MRKRDAGTEVTVFLMADAVLAAKKGQKTPEGYYNVERMLKGVVAGKGAVLLCGSCMDARGITEEDASWREGAAASWTRLKPLALRPRRRSSSDRLGKLPSDGVGPGLPERLDAGDAHHPPPAPTVVA